MFIISFGAWILYISQHETKESSCWSFPFDKVRWQMEESLCSIGTSTRNHRITIAMCLYQKTEGNHSRRCSSNGHRSVTDGIPLQSFAFKVKWVLLPLNVDDEGLRRHNLYTTHVFFFRAIYRPFSPDIIPFRVWNSYPFLDGFLPPVQKSGGKTPAEVSTFVKMWFWSTLLPALPVQQRKTQLGVGPLQCHWVATPFCCFKKKKWPWSTSWKTQKGDQVDVFSEFDVLFGPIRDSWLGGC